MGNCLFTGGGRAEERFHHGGVGPPLEEEDADLAAQGERYRRRAEEASKRARDLKAQSQEAWRSGDRKRAKELSDLAKAKKAGL